MSFARIEYLPFMGLVLLLWPFVPAQRRSLALLGASYVFYLWFRPWNAVWLIGSTLVDFWIGRRLGATDDLRRRKALLWASVALNLGLLGTFKYAGWLALNLQSIGIPVPGVAALQGLALPLGISFYTFQTLSYTIDVYRGRLKPCVNLVDYALYVSFFPQLVAGPIERARHLLPQLRKLAPLTAPNLAAGGSLILWGLLKKTVVGDRLVGEVWPVFMDAYALDSLSALVGASAMLAVLYLDFSAYTDLARGSARLFGVRLVQNFDHPFVATSIQEWTRRWHISLQTWIVDYVHAPLARGVPTHAKIWRTNLVVMALFGLWHGARWTFLFWGLAYGVLVSVEHSRRLSRMRSGRGPAPAPTSHKALRNVVAWALTLFVSVQFIVLFFSPNMSFARDFVLAQFSATLPANAERWAWCGAVGLGLLGLLSVHFATARWKPAVIWPRIPMPLRALVLIAGVGAALFGRVTSSRPFIYFDF